MAKNDKKEKHKLSRIIIYIGFIIGLWTSYLLPLFRNKIGVTILCIVLILLGNKLIDKKLSNN